MEDVICSAAVAHYLSFCVQRYASINSFVFHLQVCTVTLCLFETMLSFNMEDVMFSLVFQYLLSGSFLLPELRYEMEHLSTSLSFFFI
jgi:hypothetical protein